MVTTAQNLCSTDSERTTFCSSGFLGCVENSQSKFERRILLQTGYLKGSLRSSKGEWMRCLCCGKEWPFGKLSTRRNAIRSNETKHTQNYVKAGHTFCFYLFDRFILNLSRVVTIEENRKNLETRKQADLGSVRLFNQPMGANVWTVAQLQHHFGGETVEGITFATHVACTIRWTEPAVLS